MSDCQRISYFENATDGNNADSDGDFQIDDEHEGVPDHILNHGASDALNSDSLLRSQDNDSDECDVDEHSSKVPETVKSPVKMDMAKKAPTNTSGIMRPRHKRNLSDVPEEPSQLSSGQVSVDKMFMSPDLLA